MVKSPPSTWASVARVARRRLTIRVSIGTKATQASVSISDSWKKRLQVQSPAPPVRIAVTSPKPIRLMASPCHASVPPRYNAACSGAIR